MRNASRPALVGETGRLTYAELEQRIGVAAAKLRACGVEPGDRVALLLPNGPASVAALLGVLRIGAVAVPLNVLLSKPEVEKRIALSGAMLLVDDEDELAGGAEPVTSCAEAADGEAAVVLFTSGTSGAPKGAILTHGGLHAAAQNAAGALRLEPVDVVLGAAPFSHVLGLATGVLATLLSGSAISVVRRFQADSTLALMAETRTTILLGVPTMLIALCDAARGATGLPPIRIAHVGGAGSRSRSPATTSGRSAARCTRVTASQSSPGSRPRMCGDSGGRPGPSGCRSATRSCASSRSRARRCRRARSARCSCAGRP